MSPFRQEWARITHYIYGLKPALEVEAPEGLSRFLFRSLRTSKYRTFSKAVVIVNVVVLACFYSGQSLV